MNEEGTSYTEDSSSVWVGNGSSAAASYTGLRFNSVHIPQGKTISAAYLSFYSPSGQWVNIAFQMAGDSTGNSAPFSSSAKPSGRTFTTAKINHSSDTLWSASTWNNLNDMSAVIQELVNRADWQSGNSISIILKGTGSTWARKFANSFEAGAATAPKLVITYS